MSDPVMQPPQPPGPFLVSPDANSDKPVVYGPKDFFEWEGELILHTHGAAKPIPIPTSKFWNSQYGHLLPPRPDNIALKPAPEDFDGMFPSPKPGSDAPAGEPDYGGGGDYGSPGGYTGPTPLSDPWW